MVVLCGIDGSAGSHDAARAAAALAKMLGEPLHLAHVVEALVFSSDALTGGMPVAVANTAHLDADREHAKKLLERTGQGLKEAFGVEVRHSVRAGLPDHELVQIAKEEDVSLLVVASIGRRASSMWRFGSVADRLSQSAPVSTLIVRRAESIVRWAGERAPMSVLLALGTGQPTLAAARAAQRLCKLGPCKLEEVHAYDPVHEARRMGLADPSSPQTRERIESSLARSLPGRSLTPDATFKALPARDEVVETLTEYAEEHLVDLLVVGSHHHGGMHRRVFGSTSYGLVASVESNVLVVPTVSEESEARPRRETRRILVATDLSPTGNAALDVALGLAPQGAHVVLLHVDVPPDLPSGFIMGYHPSAYSGTGERKLKRALTESELEKLTTGADPSIEFVVDTQVSDDVPRAILEAAERHSADLVCMGTHRYGRLASTLIGSVARSVARRSKVPVLLVPDVPLE